MLPQANRCCTNYLIDMGLLIGLLLGVLCAVFFFLFFKGRQSKQKIQIQSLVLLERIKSVCKCISVEGNFTEIYNYQDVQQKFLNLVSSQKKALVIVSATAHVGFDLTKIKIESDSSQKKIILRDFPKSELISIETQLEYYDKKEGYFNKFKAEDLTQLQKSAKQHIVDKIPKSGLLEKAQQEALETIGLMEQIVQTIGWTLYYSALELEQFTQKQIECA